jgi:Uma2 family endonuclease
MTALRQNLMTVEQFYAWAHNRPERWELLDGEAVPMSPGRVIHGQTKYRVASALDGAIAKAGLPCHMLLDGVAVEIDVRNSYQPDVLVYCGETASPDALVVRNPVIVVEVLSPSNALKDLRDKLQGYFRVPSIQHYLIADPDKRIVIHHARAQDAIATRIVSEGDIALEPPGLSFTVLSLFG